MRDPVRTINRLAWRDNRLSEGARAIPEETALALTYNGGTYAVMMGTPQNLEDFAIGFSLSEGVVQSPEEISSLEIVDLDDGIELRMWLAEDKAARLSERRRHIAAEDGHPPHHIGDQRRSDPNGGTGAVVERSGRQRRILYRGCR